MIIRRSSTARWVPLLNGEYLVQDRRSHAMMILRGEVIALWLCLDAAPDLTGLRIVTGIPLPRIRAYLKTLRRMKLVEATDP